MRKKEKSSKKNPGKPEQGKDFYMENGLLVFTAKYLKNRGYCCSNGCRHCPWKK